MGERGRENLYDVVSEGVRDEQMGLVDDRVHETIVIERRSTQEELLDHAAAMAMRGDLGVRERGGEREYFDAVLDEFFEERRAERLGKGLQTAKNHVVAVGMSGEMSDVSLESREQRVDHGGRGTTLHGGQKEGEILGQDSAHSAFRGCLETRRRENRGQTTAERARSEQSLRSASDAPPNTPGGAFGRRSCRRGPSLARADCSAARRRLQRLRRGWPKPKTAEERGIRCSSWPFPRCGRAVL